MSEIEIFQRLGIALAIGLLVGIERGWAKRELAEGARVAGIRTFGLVSVLGAIWALLDHEIVLGVAYAGFAALLVTAYWFNTRERHDLSITTAVAALITFALGALTMQGYVSAAAGTAVVTAILLGLKPTLHHWLERLQAEELSAALKLLLISVVILPVLPNRGFGPSEILNPFLIWWMVVLIAGISFAGYFAIKIVGPGIGVMLTAVFGGLVSSTAVTLNFARQARDEPDRQPLLSAGIVTSSTTMFVRMLLLLGVIQPSLLVFIGPPLGAMAAVGYGFAYVLWRGSSKTIEPAQVYLQNPVELRVALAFGVMLAVVMFLAKGAQDLLGEQGVYVLAALSGITDVDAATISMAQLAPTQLDLSVASMAIAIAAMVNTATKGILAAVIGRGAVALRTGTAFLGMLVTGLAVLLMS
jgi:uncharacterized membrane protein (DUF4010 family)